jgi:hypothetical protein|tara:strand:+ start:390 stop:2315 length:1926 start_codon:yes stop_codon:yes gene_type:complete
MTDKAHHGWESSFPDFRDAETTTICFKLEKSVDEPGEAQLRAWKADVPKLKNEVGEILQRSSNAAKFSTILEYELPMESRRPDVIFLVNGAIVVLELKGKTSPSQADIDQVSAYARDLRCYHKECESMPVHAVLIPTRATGYIGNECGVDILGPDTIDSFIEKLDRDRSTTPVPVNDFLSVDAYRPLPTLVAAARELFQRGDIRPIHRARAATDPAVETISKIIHRAAKTSTRHLILLTGIPGAGKTLVGLRIAHAHFLDDLSVEREDEKPTTPAVYLSGNGPLIEVLQYELRKGGGGGKTFVRGVKDYVKKYSKSNSPTPPEHVLIFDEAQRAWNKEQVQAKHANTPGFESGKSEPEHFVEFSNRIPQWSVVIGLIGGGQEIYVGEEGGIGQWKDAILGVDNSSDWTVHGPAGVKNSFNDPELNFTEHSELSLDREIRFHFATNLHKFVGELLDVSCPPELTNVANSMQEDGYAIRITRDLGTAEKYLRERYSEAPESRFGLLASSRDKSLVTFGIKNDFISTSRVKKGPWYSDPEDDPSRKSCRHLVDCLTEFDAQGLELDCVLLAWGTDFCLKEGNWNIEKSRNYKNPSLIKDSFQLRLNSYRVLLTRGRDGTVVFVPPIDEMDETYEYLCDCGFRIL